MENPTPVVATTPGSTPKFGLTALVLSLIPFPLFTIWVAVLIGTPVYINRAFGNIALIGIGCLGLLVPLAGVVLGILSLLRREPKRGVAIAGIIVGILIAICMVIVVYLSFTTAFAVRGP